MSQQHPASALRYDAVRPGAEITLTGEEFEQYVKKTEALQKLLTDTSIRAKYKIELMFGTKRSIHDVNPGVLSFWLSGSKLHGGGDEKVYLCPGYRLKQNGCQRPLESSFHTGRSIICPGCGNNWPQPDVDGEVLARLSMQNWATVIYKYFKLLDFDCDIYLKYAPTDIRTISLAQKEKATWDGSKKLDNVRKKRGSASYPLRNIITDVNNGADVVKRFHAFLVA